MHNLFEKQPILFTETECMYMYELVRRSFLFVNWVEAQLNIFLWRS